MNSLVRLLVCFVAVSGVLAGVLSLQPVWFASLGFDVWALPELQRQIAQCVQRNEELNRCDQAVCQRMDGKRSVIHELIVGRLSFDDAVAQFRTLNEKQPSVVETMLERYPGLSLEEVTRRQVLGWAEGHLEVDAAAEQREEVRARLRQESGLYSVTR
jgi:hypothetical protein